MGAGWRRIASSLLVESTLLGLIGGVAGLALAATTLPVLLSIAAQELPSMLDITIDPAVLAFTLAISLGSGLLFGLIPVVKYARPTVAAMLSGTGRSHSVSRERHRARNSLVVMQVALALVLLVASGLMIRTFQALRDVDPGFTDPEQIQTLHLSISQATVPEFDRVIRMQNEICDRLSAIAGVESVAFSSRSLPLVASGPNGPFSLEDKPGVAPLGIEFRYTSPNLFRTLGTRLVAGRDFQWTDHYGTRQVVIVSETFARREWGSPAAAIGKRMRRSERNPWLEVVGVAGDIRHRGLDQPAPDTVYLTSSETLAPYMSRDAYFFIRSERVGTAGFIDEIQRAIWSVNGSVPLGRVQTMGELYRRSTARTSLTLVLLSITGAMALALGLVGIYGVISYMFTQRTREIGIRMALGARNAALKRMLLSQVLRVVGVGCGSGSRRSGAPDAAHGIAVVRRRRTRRDDLRDRLRDRRRHGRARRLSAGPARDTHRPDAGAARGVGTVARNRRRGRGSAPRERNDGSALPGRRDHWECTPMTTRSFTLARLRRHREAFLNPRLPERCLAGDGPGRLIAVEVEA